MIPQPSRLLLIPYTNRAILLSIVRHLTGTLQLRYCNLGYGEELPEELRVSSGVKSKHIGIYEVSDGGLPVTVSLAL
jgi:hypothetical protein